MPELASFQNVTQFECVISQDGQFTEVGDYKPNHVLYLSFAARKSSKGMIYFTCQTNGAANVSGEKSRWSPKAWQQAF